MLLENPIVIGRVSGVYGVKGWVRVFSETADREGVFSYRKWFLSTDGSNWQQWKVKDGRLHGKGVVVKLEGCNDRDQAAALIGQDIAIERKDLPPAQQDEYYWTDLEGMKVLTVDGVNLGTISHLFETGANDVVVVKGDKERLIPYLRDQVIKKVDLDNAEMVVDWDPDF